MLDGSEIEDVNAAGLAGTTALMDAAQVRSRHSLAALDVGGEIREKVSARFPNPSSLVLS